MLRKTGQRVFMTLTNDQTGEERYRPGTVDHDEIQGWDYTDVRFDDFPAMVQPILSYYLFDGEPPKGE